jgi:hypothetical protein
MFWRDEHRGGRYSLYCDEAGKPPCLQGDEGFEKYNRKKLTIKGNG